MKGILLGAYCSGYRGHCTASPSWTIKCIHMEAGVHGFRFCPALCGVTVCGVESCAPPPHKPLSPVSKPLQSHTSWEMDLDGAPQEDSCGAKSVISKCQTICLLIAIYFPTSIIFLWNTSRISCPLSNDCYYLFRLISHNSGIKASSVFITFSCQHCKHLQCWWVSNTYVGTFGAHNH